MPCFIDGIRATYHALLEGWKFFHYIYLDLLPELDKITMQNTGSIVVPPTG